MSTNEVTVTYNLRLLIPVSITVDLGDDLTEEDISDPMGIAGDADIVRVQEASWQSVSVGDVQEAVGGDSDGFCEALCEAIREAHEAGLLDVEPEDGGAA